MVLLPYYFHNIIIYFRINKEAKTIKIIILVSLLLLILLILILPISVLSDFSNGDFEIDTFNDPPVFTDWFDSKTLLEENEAVVFHATIEDTDNSSSELTVQLFYSTDSFTTTNFSLIMSFDSEPTTDNYKFIYNFAGRSAGTYYSYYYQVNESSTFVKLPSQTDIYFDIQWAFAGDETEIIFVDGRGGIIAGSRAVDELTTTTTFLFFITFTTMFYILFVMRKRNNRVKKRRIGI